MAEAGVEDVRGIEIPRYATPRRFFPPTENNLPDRIPGSQPNPLRDRTILFLCSGELLLGAEGFMGLVVKIGGQFSLRYRLFLFATSC